MCQNYAKCELNKIKRYDAQIDFLCSEAARIRGLALKVTTTISGDVGGGCGSKDKIADAVARIIDLENEINEKIDDLILLKERLMNCINRLSKPEYITVLERRYFKYDPFHVIADEMGYSERNVGYIHGYALKELNEILKGENANVPS